MTVDQVDKSSPFPKLNGCICDVCAERGAECHGVAFSEYDDYCARCLRHSEEPHDA